MKTIKKVVLLLAALFGVLASPAADKKELTTVAYQAAISCENCKAKLEKNIPFEKGVKKLTVDLEKKTVTVTFRRDRNNAEKIKKAIEKLGFAVSSYSTVEEEAV
ncbi:MAG: heavy-metal-associated domain-containing protein [Culturomica sp.]|jgi:copper chaperone CopZ|nr:heavy-metal-associated domain-containing protein [Culturomica sp.]